MSQPPYNPKVLVVTSNRYKWALQPFAYLFNIYWSSLQPVDVLGFSRPDFSLPDNFNFISLGDEDYGQQYWSNALRLYLENCHDKQIVLMLEDYWLVRTVDCEAVGSLCEYMTIHPEVLRIDLTTDRLHAFGDARNAIDLESWGRLDLILSPNGVQYNMSLQAGLWDKDKLLSLIPNGMTPWEVELNINPPEDMVVLGTRQWPVRYANGVQKGKVDREQIKLIQQPHRSDVESMIPSGWEVFVP